MPTHPSHRSPCTPGATVRVTTTWPQPVADFTKHSQGAFLPASPFAITLSEWRLLLLGLLAGAFGMVAQRRKAAL